MYVIEIIFLYWKKKLQMLSGVTLQLIGILACDAWKGTFAI